MKISIVTPSYNHAEFRERTLMSVLTQAWDFDLEYIVMDGWSTDGSQDILARIQKEVEEWTFPKACRSISFSRVSEKDKGQSDAINKWLKLVTGDIVTYINSDDTYLPWALQHVCNSLWKSDAQRCYGKCKIIDRYDNEIRKPITRYKNIAGKKYSYWKLLAENFISQMTVFWKKEAMHEIGLFNVDEHLCMDYEYRVRLGKRRDPVYIDAYIANFRFYHTSKSGSRFTQQFADELRIAKEYAWGKYRWSIFLHKLNYYKICTAYKILSRLKW